MADRSKDDENESAEEKLIICTYNNMYLRERCYHRHHLFDIHPQSICNKQLFVWNHAVDEAPLPSLDPDRSDEHYML